jgi:hypothetical protein
VLNPTDWWRILRTKDSQGRYLFGDPASVAAARLWNLDVVPTNNMTSGEFLVGSGNPEATVIRDRMEVQIEVATQHSDYFTKNLVAIRCEKRLALVTRRPASFVHGTFTMSPGVIRHLKEWSFHLRRLQPLPLQSRKVDGDSRTFLNFCGFATFFEVFHELCIAVGGTFQLRPCKQFVKSGSDTVNLILAVWIGDNASVERSSGTTGGIRNYGDNCT